MKRTALLRKMCRLICDALYFDAIWIADGEKGVELDRAIRQLIDCAEKLKQLK